MRYVRTTLAIAIALVFLGNSAFAEVECTFHTRSTIEGNQRLSGGRFRVRYMGETLMLEHGFADGKWYDFVDMMRIIRPGFDVYLYLRSGGAYVGRARMLTVHQSGHASLAIHHGTAGGGTQINGAWLYHGSCKKISSR